MAKTTTTTTISPQQFSASYGVFFEDTRAVVEMSNWAFANRAHVHVSMATGDDGWSSGSLQTLAIKFPTTSGWAQRLFFRIIIPAETLGITVGARCTMAVAGQEGQIRVTIGAAAPVVLPTFTFGTNAIEQSISIATATTGVSEVDVRIEINHTLGVLGTNIVRNLRVEEDFVAVASMPDPPDGSGSIYTDLVAIPYTDLTGNFYTEI